MVCQRTKKGCIHFAFIVKWNDHGSFIKAVEERIAALAASPDNLIPERYLREIIPSVTEYFYNPNQETFDNIVYAAAEIGASMDRDPSVIVTGNWSSYIGSVIGSLSTGLALGLNSRGDELLAMNGNLERPNQG